VEVRRSAYLQGRRDRDVIHAPVKLDHGPMIAIARPAVRVANMR